MGELGLERLELIADPQNLVSQRVAGKVGFQREGIVRSHLQHPDGRRRDNVSCPRCSQTSSADDLDEGETLNLAPRQPDEGIRLQRGPGSPMPVKTRQQAGSASKAWTSRSPSRSPVRSRT